jgi:succinyl-CoA synthetase beta subunit
MIVEMMKHQRVVIGVVSSIYQNFITCEIFSVEINSLNIRESATSSPFQNFH